MTLSGWRAIVHDALQGFRLGHPGELVPALRRPWGSSRPDNKGAVRSVVGGQESSALKKLAFAFLCLLVFTIPWEDAITIADFGTSARLIGIVTVVFGILAIIESGKVRRPAPGHLIMALFVTLAAVSYLWSLFPEGTLVQVITYVQLLAMVWLIWEHASQAGEQMRLMQAYVLGTFVSGADTAFRYFSHQEAAYQRYAGSGLDANDLGLMMALSIPVSYYLLIQSKGKIVWVYRLQLVLAGATVLLTASRGATLATIVALAIVPLTHTRLTGGQKIAVLLTFSLLVTGAFFFVPASSWERLSTVPDELAQGSLTGRTIIWSAGWEVFRDHPFLGVGANAFRLIVSRVLAEPIRPDEPDPAPPAHNTFLSVLVEQGIIGFTVFCALLVVLALSVREMPLLPRRLWIVCLAVWVLGVSSLTWEMRKPTWFFFGLLIAQSGNVARGRIRITQSRAPALVNIKEPFWARHGRQDGRLVPKFESPG